MRILVVSQYFWPETFIINDLVQLLHDRGVEVTVLTGKPNYPGGRIFEGYRMCGVQRETLGPVKIVRLPLYPRGQRSAFGLALNYLSFIASGILFAPRALRNDEYDLVFVYAPSPLLQALSGAWLARLRKVPLLVWVQDLWPESLSATNHINNRHILAVIARVVRMIYRSADRILVQSRAFIEPVAVLADHSEKIHYYPNFYQTPMAHEPSMRALELISALRQYFSIVFAGNLGTAQSLDTIVDAARQLKSHQNIRIVLVGSGSMDQWLADQCEKYQLENLKLAGRFEFLDMPAIFEVAAGLLVTLKPDPTFELTIPSKVQAYLAAGRPIVAALDGEGARVIKESGAGLYSAAGDAGALVASILRLADLSDAERQKMGKQGRAYYERNFAPEMLADELIGHFREVMSSMEKN